MHHRRVLQFLQTTQRASVHRLRARVLHRNPRRSSLPALSARYPLQIVHNSAIQRPYCYTRTRIAGLFSRDAGQQSCVNCDAVGNAYQELPGQSSCQLCKPHSARYIGVLTSANRSACQCKEGWPQSAAHCPRFSALAAPLAPQHPHSRWPKSRESGLR